MAKKRSFSIYLLKSGFDAANSLKTGTPLEAAAASNLPAGAQLFLLDQAAYTPWWKDYFGIERPVTQSHKGALVFLPVRDRWCALTFGYVSHNLKDECYEYDFGLKTTLNCVDPKKLRSTDTVEPGASRRRRTQLPSDSELTVFDVDRDSSIIKGLTGKVKDEYADIFKHITGASSLRMSSDATAAQIATTCERLLQIYEKDDYKTEFPDIRAIEPVKDPNRIKLLEEKLLVALKAKSSLLTITVPDMINYGEGLRAAFGSAKRSRTYDDVAMPYYHDHLATRQIALESVDIGMLKKQMLSLCDENGDTRASYSIHKCLLFDTSLDEGGPGYHLFEGNWYLVEREYVAKLKEFLDPYFKPTTLLPYNHDSEGAYNKAVSENSQEYICLDRTNMSPRGQTNIEPCDLYSVEDGHAVFTHVKVSTRSQLLSHLFNQGTTSIEGIKQEPAIKERLKTLVSERLNGRDAESFLSPLDQEKHRVVYAIATEKPAEGLSSNLPLFSRMSLRRNIKFLNLVRVPVKCCYVQDTREDTMGAADTPATTVTVGSLRMPKESRVEQPIEAASEAQTTNI